MEGTLYKRNKEAEKSAKAISIIHWQTGEPKEEGTYVTTRETSRGHIYTCENFWYKGRWYAKACDNSTTIAWCKLSDIKPYKEEEL